MKLHDVGIYVKRMCCTIIRGASAGAVRSRKGWHMSRHAALPSSKQEHECVEVFGVVCGHGTEKKLIDPHWLELQTLNFKFHVHLYWADQSTTNQEQKEMKKNNIKYVRYLRTAFSWTNGFKSGRHPGDYLDQALANYIPWAKYSPLPVFVIKSCTVIIAHIVCACFCTTRAELNSYDRLYWPHILKYLLSGPL